MQGKKPEADGPSAKDTPEAILPTPEHGKSVAPSAAVTDAGADKGLRRRNRAERAALQQEQELQQQQQAKQQRR